jgi:hypothetical protein
MIHPPINAVTWSIGATALYTFGWKSWRSYRRTKNPLSRIYYILGLTFGTGLFFFGVPALFTDNLHILRYTYFLADMFVQITLQVALYLLWFLGLQGRVRLSRIYLVSIPFSAVLLTLQALTSQVGLSLSPHLVVYTDQPAVLILKSISYLTVAMPIGYFLIRQTPKQPSLRAKTKAFMSGMTFILVGLAATSNNLFDKGSDTVQSAAIVGCFFVFFLLVQLLRPSTQAPHN